MPAVKAPRGGETATGITPARRSSANRRAPVDGDISGRGRRVPQTPEQKRSAAIIGGASCGFVMLLILGILVFGSSKDAAPKKPAEAEKEQPGKINSTAPKAVKSAPQIERKRETVGPGALRRVSTPPRSKPKKPVLDDGTGVQHRPGPSLLSPKPVKRPVAKPKAKSLPPPAPKKPAPVVEPKTKQPAPTPDPTKDLAKRDRKQEVEEEEEPADQAPTAAPEKKPEDPKKVVNPFDPEAKKPPPQPKPQKVFKPVFVRGKNCNLFPPDRDSTVGEHVSPAADVGQKKSGIKETKYPGWSWQSQNRTGFNVKKGVLTLKSQGILVLDAFNATEFNLSFEVKLAKNSAVGIQLGSAQKGIPLMFLVPHGVVPGVFDPSKKKGQIKTDDKKGKRVPLAAWTPVRIAARATSVEVYVRNKSVFKGPPMLQVTGPLFGFLNLGLNKNKNPSAQLRKVQVFAP